MSETTEISAIERTRVGKGSARASRRAGMIPAGGLLNIVRH